MNKNNQDKKENLSSEQTQSLKHESEKQTNVPTNDSVHPGKEIPAEIRLQELEKKLTEINDKYVRLYADFENYRKRSSKEKIELLQLAGENIFKQLLPVLDDFERALKAMADIADINVIKQGEELIYNKMKNILTQNGLAEMKSLGEPFNSDLHDAISNIPAPSEEQKGKVIEETEKGYYLNGKVIRHAKVVVGQ